MARVGSSLPISNLQLPGASPSHSRSDLRRLSVTNASYSSQWNTARSEDPDDEDNELVKTRFSRSSKSQKAREEKMENRKNQEQSELRSFICKNFHRKECNFFCEDQEGKCKCGDTKDNHDLRILRQSTGENWSEKCLVKVEGPTNAYGGITLKNEGFDNREPIQFVRLCDEDNMDKILELMKVHWKMADPQLPSLCLSVIGGAKNFKLEGRKKDIFHQGLIRAAQTTNAWIITSGLNLGITRVVGNALEEGRATHWEKSKSSKLRCIGVAPWGYVLNRKDLLNETDTTGQAKSMDVSYKISNVVSKGQPVSLNASHTHYLLVDDGKRNRYGGSKSAVVKAKLQQQIKKKENIPVVLLIVEGGLDIFEDARSMIEEEIPIVTCDNTGRAADIIASAFKKVQKSEHKELTEAHMQDLRDRMIIAFRENLVDRKDPKKIDERKLDQNLDHLRRIVQQEQYITVFDMNRSDDLDLAILSALLKVMNARKLDDYKKQLQLSLTWNRADIAAEKIFTEEHQWDTENLQHFTIQAIEQDKTDFLKLFLKNGLIMREFLTVSKLKGMYNHCLTNHSKNQSTIQLRKMLLARTKFNGNKLYLRDVRVLLRKLIGKFKAPSMDIDCPKSDPSIEHEQFDHPFNQLFFWAVLLCRQHVAKFLWERTDDAVPLALAACKIYDEMVRNEPSHQDERVKMLMGFKEEFEDLAVHVIEECQVVDPTKAELLVEKKVEAFGDFNCLELAASAGCKRFLSCNTSQSSITSRWLNGLRHGTSNFRIFLCLLLPFLLPSELLVRMEPGAVDENEGICSKMATKVRVFYTAPVTKFFANTICYVLFLFLFSWFILFEMKQNSVTWLEWVIIAWIGVMVVEEIREMFSSKADSIREKLRDWWGFSVWNRLDVVTILFAIVSIVLRAWIPNVTKDMFMAIRTFYILAGVLFYLRLFRLYYANSYLGPKLVMINKMVKELMFYMSILCVALVTYGVASQALLYPNRSFMISVFKDILYYPYWQIYGEIYLEVAEAQAEGCNGTTLFDSQGNHCPTEHFLVPLLLAVYLIVVNVLLLNLLIAIFSNIFEDIEKNSIEVWKFNMYFLVHEYHTRPILAVPFVIFEDVYRLCRFIARCRPCHKKDEFRTGPTLPNDELRSFSSHCVSLVQSRQDYQMKAELAYKVQQVSEGLDELYKMCDRIDERFEDEMQIMTGQRHQTQDEERYTAPSVLPKISLPGGATTSINEDVRAEKPKQFKEVLPLPTERSLTAADAADSQNATPNATSNATLNATSKRHRRKKKRSRSRHSDDEGAATELQPDKNPQLNIRQSEETEDRLMEMERRLSSMEAATTHSLTSIERLLRQILKDKASAADSSKQQPW